MNMIPPVRATEQGRAQNVNPRSDLGIVVLRAITLGELLRKSFGKRRQRGWESRPRGEFFRPVWLRRVAYFGHGVLMGGNFLPKLNMDVRPIAKKYREGKMKRTLERELKVPEIAKREANETSFSAWDCCWLGWISVPQGQSIWSWRQWCLSCSGVIDYCVFG